MNTNQIKNVLTHGYVETAKGDNVDKGINNILGEEVREVSRSFSNHLNKLLIFLASRIRNNEERDEASRAVEEFVKVAIDRDSDGVRNAYVSFTRHRRQRLCKDSDGNESQNRRGRPNLYTGEGYRSITNRRK